MGLVELGEKTGLSASFLSQLETGRVVLDGPYQTLLADDRVRRSYLGLT